MATIGLLLSIAIAAMLYGRGILDDSAIIPLVFLSTAVFIFGGFTVWLTLMLPLFPAWFEAILNTPLFAKRYPFWVISILLLPAAALTAGYVGYIELPLKYIAMQAAMLLALELKQHTIPHSAWFKKRSLPPIVVDLCAISIAALAASLAAVYWLKDPDIITAQIAASAFAVVAVCNILTLSQKLLKTTPLIMSLQSEPAKSVFAYAAIWGVILYNDYLSTINIQEVLHI